MNNSPHLIVGVTGGSGGGKTYFVNRLQESFNRDDLFIIPQDNYYKDLSDISLHDRAATNFDHPDSVDFELLAEHLRNLRQGNTIEMPEYDFVTHTRKQGYRIVEPKPIIIVDGILILSAPEVVDLMDLKIYIDTPDDIRILRRILRDIRERGRSVDSVIKQYLNSVRPMHKQFIEPTKKFADYILSGEEEHPEIIELIKSRIG